MMGGALYGCTIHTEAWIKDHWSNGFTVHEHRPTAVSGVQDLNILQKL
jgi:hypothetical protein